MSREQIAAKAKELAGHLSENGESGLLSYRADIERLYWLVCRKALRRCNCRNVLSDAVIEINVQIKKGYTMTRATLKAGAVIQYKGGIYTNANITDEVAQAYLADFPKRAGLFSVLPPEKAVTEEVAAPVESDTAPTEVVEKPKKKTTKKRKK